MPSKAKPIALALLLAACGGGHQRLGAMPPLVGGLPSYGDYDRTGFASWYGEELTGNRTASGDRFDPAAITAAHRTLPLGSFIEVTALDTGRSILVRVNDRGPFHGNRLVDLSRGAAHLLGTDRRPVSQVRIRTVQPSAVDMATLRAGRAVAAREAMPGIVRVASDDMAALAPRPMPRLDPSRRYTLTVATFSNAERARKLAEALDADIVGTGALYRVRLGPYKASELQRARDDVARRGYGDAVIQPAD